ncbi:MAG: hypothetical protein NTV61_02795 [Candidatus Bathyarchaeota archaeon]|nr:hypothetical protein [Candidatus Bathyarchaeota archaeon]
MLLCRRLVVVFLLALALTPAASATPSNTTIKTILIISHADEFDGYLPATLYYTDDPRYIVSSWNYCFQPMRGWGLYFDLKEGWTDERFTSYLELFEGRGFGNLLYVDVTECDQSYSGRWADSIVEAGPAGWLDLMSLNPEGSWYRYLRDGMVGMTRRFGGSMSGFAIDRLDRCGSAQESLWAAMLLDEVRASSAVPGLVYAMNSLQDAEHQGFLAARAEFVGSDGVPVSELSEWTERYMALASLARVKEPYIVPLINDATPGASEAGYRLVLKRGGFTFFDDRPLYLGMMERILAGCPTIRARSGFSAF